MARQLRHPTGDVDIYLTGLTPRPHLREPVPSGPGVGGRVVGSPSPRHRGPGRSRPGTAPTPSVCCRRRPGPAGPTSHRRLPGVHRSPPPRGPPAPGPQPADEPAPSPTRPPTSQRRRGRERSSFTRQTLGVTTDSRTPKSPCSTGCRETSFRFFSVVISTTGRPQPDHRRQPDSQPAFGPRLGLSTRPRNRREGTRA